MDSLLAGLSKSIAEQGPLFAGMVGFITLLATGHLLWRRELVRLLDVKDREIGKLEKSNERLQSRVDELIGLNMHAAGLIAKSADVQAMLVERSRVPRDVTG